MASCLSVPRVSPNHKILNLKRKLGEGSWPKHVSGYSSCTPASKHNTRLFLDSLRTVGLRIWLMDVSAACRKVVVFEKQLDWIRGCRGDSQRGRRLARTLPPWTAERAGSDSTELNRLSWLSSSAATGDPERKVQINQKASGLHLKLLVLETTGTGCFVFGLSKTKSSDINHLTLQSFSSRSTARSLPKLSLHSLKVYCTQIKAKQSKLNDLFITQLVFSLRTSLNYCKYCTPHSRSDSMFT